MERTAFPPAFSASEPLGSQGSCARVIVSTTYKDDGERKKAASNLLAHGDHNIAGNSHGDPFYRDSNGPGPGENNVAIEDLIV